VKLHQIQCDMDNDCTTPATMIDTAGFAYCEPHGMQRRQYEPCRKLRPYELRKLLRGEPLARY
jgi:hypothetical protein